MARLDRTRSETLDTGAAELRRIERDLHDGAQAQAGRHGDERWTPPRRLIDTESRRRPQALLYGGQRRRPPGPWWSCSDLVRGIHPPVLADRGLGRCGPRAMALDSPLRVQVTSRRCRGGWNRPGRVGRLLRGQRAAERTRPSTRPRPRPGWHRPVAPSPGASAWSPSPTTGSAAPNPARGTRAARHRAQARPPSTASWSLPARPGGPDRGDPGRAVRVVIAEDLFLLREGLIRLLEAYGFEVAAATGNGADLLAAVQERAGATWPSSTCGCRPRSPTRACGRRSTARAEFPGLPVLVALAVRRAAVRPRAARRRRGRGRLPAEGPGVSTAHSSSTR